MRLLASFLLLLASASALAGAEPEEQMMTKTSTDSASVLNRSRTTAASAADLLRDMTIKSKPTFSPTSALRRAARHATQPAPRHALRRARARSTTEQGSGENFLHRMTTLPRGSTPAVASARRLHARGVETERLEEAKAQARREKSLAKRMAGQRRNGFDRLRRVKAAKMEAKSKTVDKTVAFVSARKTKTNIFAAARGSSAARKAVRKARGRAVLKMTRRRQEDEESCALAKEEAAKECPGVLQMSENGDFASPDFDLFADEPAAAEELCPEGDGSGEYVYDGCLAIWGNILNDCHGAEAAADVIIRGAELACAGKDIPDDEEPEGAWETAECSAVLENLDDCPGVASFFDAEWWDEDFDIPRDAPETLDDICGENANQCVSVMSDVLTVCAELDVSEEDLSSGIDTLCEDAGVCNELVESAADECPGVVQMFENGKFIDPDFNVLVDEPEAAAELCPEGDGSGEYVYEGCLATWGEMLNNCVGAEASEEAIVEGAYFACAGKRLPDSGDDVSEECRAAVDDARDECPGVVDFFVEHAWWEDDFDVEKESPEAFEELCETNEEVCGGRFAAVWQACVDEETPSRIIREGINELCNGNSAVCEDIPNEARDECPAIAELMESDKWHSDDFSLTEHDDGEFCENDECAGHWSAYFRDCVGFDFSDDEFDAYRWEVCEKRGECEAIAQELWEHDSCGHTKWVLEEDVARQDPDWNPVEDAEFFDEFCNGDDICAEGYMGVVWYCTGNEQAREYVSSLPVMCDAPEAWLEGWREATGRDNENDEWSDTCVEAWQRLEKLNGHDECPYSARVFRENLIEKPGWEAEEDLVLMNELCRGCSGHFVAVLNECLYADVGDDEVEETLDAVCPERSDDIEHDDDDDDDESDENPADSEECAEAVSSLLVADQCPRMQQILNEEIFADETWAPENDPEFLGEFCQFVCGNFYLNVISSCSSRDESEEATKYLPALCATLEDGTRCFAEAETIIEGTGTCPFPDVENPPSSALLAEYCDAGCAERTLEVLRCIRPFLTREERREIDNASVVMALDVVCEQDGDGTYCIREFDKVEALGELDICSVTNEDLASVCVPCAKKIATRIVTAMLAEDEIDDTAAREVSAHLESLCLRDEGEYCMPKSTFAECDTTSNALADGASTQDELVSQCENACNAKILYTFMAAVDNDDERARLEADINLSCAKKEDGTYCLPLWEAGTRALNEAGCPDWFVENALEDVECNGSCQTAVQTFTSDLGCCLPVWFDRMKADAGKTARDWMDARLAEITDQCEAVVGDVDRCDAKRGTRVFQTDVVIITEPGTCSDETKRADVILAARTDVAAAMGAKTSDITDISCTETVLSSSRRRDTTDSVEVVIDFTFQGEDDEETDELAKAFRHAVEQSDLTMASTAAVIAKDAPEASFRIDNEATVAAAQESLPEPPVYDTDFVAEDSDDDNAEAAPGLTPGFLLVGLIVMFGAIIAQ